MLCSRGTGFASCASIEIRLPKPSMIWSLGLQCITVVEQPTNLGSLYFVAQICHFGQKEFYFVESLLQNIN